MPASRNDTTGQYYESTAYIDVFVTAWDTTAQIAPGDRLISRLSPIVINATSSLQAGQDLQYMHFIW